MSLVGGDWPGHVGENEVGYVDAVCGFTFYEEHVAILEGDLYDKLWMFRVHAASSKRQTEIVSRVSNA